MDQDFIGQVAVKALIVKNGKALIVRDHRDHDLWEFPGGHINVGESVEQALIRETKEELGVDIEMDDLLYSEQVIHKSRGTPHLFLIFGATLTNPEQPLKVPTDEIAEIRWVDKNSMKDFKFYEECVHTLDVLWN